ncbi:MAG: FG-GAP repeat protein [Aquabacterium sp.]|nr:FG-GAP repeat protein [Aquabacterium sp.]
MYSLFMQRTVGRALGALTVALSTALVGCGGGEIDSSDGGSSPHSETGLDGQARALSAGTSTLDAALTENTAAFGTAAGIAQVQKFGAPNGMAGDLFGWSVATLGSRVVVGAPQQSIFSSVFNRRGVAYVFDASGVLVRELLPTSANELARDDFYGRSVAASGNIIAVGSPGADDVGQFAGEVFLFNATTGAQVANLVPTGTRRNPADGAAFGSAVDVSANRIVVGAPGTFIDGASSGGISAIIGGFGAIYLYDANTRRLIARVTPPGTRAKDNVGHAVSVEGSTVVAGAPFDSISAREAGAAYVFNSSNGSLRLKLTASDASAEDRFGFAVSTNGGIIAVGAPFDDDAGSESGSVYLFNATTGAFIRKIVANDAGINDQFGIALDLIGNTLAVGAWGDNDGAGSVYIFDVTTGTQLGKLVASDAAPRDILGRAVALSSSAVIAGAARDGDRGTDSGSVYRFGLPTP